MGNVAKRILVTLVLGVLTYVIGVALLFLSYNWTTFVQFVKNFNIEVAITLIVPALLAGWVIRDRMPRRTKKS